MDARTSMAMLTTKKTLSRVCPLIENLLSED
jgi:hypothetical protein